MSYCKSTIAINKNISILSYSALEFLCIFLLWKANCCYLSLTFQSHFLNHCLSLWCNVLVCYCLESVLTDFWSFIFMGCMCSQAVIIKKKMSVCKHTENLSWQQTHFSLLFLLIFTLVLRVNIPTRPFVIVYFSRISRIFFFFFLQDSSVPLSAVIPSPISLSLLFDGWSVCRRIFWL